MLTTLMMLLGLSGAGADLNDIAGSEGGGRPNVDLSPRQKRRQKQRQSAEVEDTKPQSKSPKKERPSSGGRGQELNFQTDPKEPKSKPKPLSERLSDFDEEEEEQGEALGEGSGKEPKSGRGGRREKQKPPKSLSDLPLGEFGEEGSESPSSGERPRREKPDISFSADDIISKNSKYSFHRRPLLNAEALVEAEQVEEAIEIFERTGNRIPDQEIKEKIKKNIQDLEEFLEDNPPSGKPGEPGKDEKSKQDPLGKEKPKKKDQKPGVGTKPDKDLTDLVGALKEVSELFAESIARAIQFAQSSPPPNFPQSPQSLPQSTGSSAQQTSQLPPPPLPPNAVETATPAGKPIQPSPAQGPSPISGPQINQNVSGGNQLVHPIVYQFLQSSPQAPGFDPKVTQNQDQLLQSLNQGLTTGGLASGFPGAPMAPPGSGIVGPFYVPPDMPGAGMPGGLGSPTAPGGLRQPLDLQTLADQISKKDVSELDLPEDTFFSNDWKQFKDLPLVDRRSGEERRKNADRRTNLAGRKDRRSGEDRRKKNRFLEREDFLKNQALKKIEKKAKELEAKGEEASLNDLLKPYFPDQPNLKLPEDWGLEPIGLPDPNDLRRDEKEPPLHPQEKAGSGEEPNWFDSTTDALRKELELPDPIDPQTEKLISPKADLPAAKDPDQQKSETIIETDLPIQVELTNRPLTSEDLRIGLPDADEVFRDRKLKEEAGGATAGEGPALEDAEAPEIEIVDGNLGEIAEEESPIPLDEMAEKATEDEPEKIIHGVLELKPPEADDAPFLTLTYDFGKIPHAFRLSKNYSIMEYSYYKYKPMLMKAQEFARRKMLKNALNYYRVIKSQNIPPELRKMINRNIRDITEFMEKFLMAKGN